MKKSLFLIALASMAVVGCSKDEITEINPDNAIKFTATAAKATRSTITTTSNLDDFYMYAYASNDPSQRFMDGVVAKESDPATTWAYKSATKFWPNTGTVDFYAVHPVSVVADFGMTNTVSATSQTIKDFIVDDDVKNQIDLIYATALGESKPATTNSPVTINFRHALSQIVFQAQVTNTALSVDINGVKVGKLANKSTLTFPSKDTTPHRNDDPGNLKTEDDTTEGDTWGDWGEKTGSVVYTAGITENTNIGSEIVDLTTANSGELLLLPQNTTAWTATGGITDNTTGSYFLVSCKIRDVASGVYLWGSANEYKEVAVPFSADWKQGKKYIYKFIFNDGGGYDPEDGDPVLVPIKFTVTVDEFQSVDDIEIEM